MKGILEDKGYHRLSDGKTEFYGCIDCSTWYVVVNKKIRCNGHTITKCPWCREYSEPWKNGRGV